MSIIARHLAAVFAFTLLSCSLTGCASINEKLAAGLSELSPIGPVACLRTRRPVPAPRNTTSS
jgi:hypothetical protein